MATLIQCFKKSFTYVTNRLELKVSKVEDDGEDVASNGNSSDEVVNWDVAEIEGETIAKYFF